MSFPAPRPASCSATACEKSRKSRPPLSHAPMPSHESRVPSHDLVEVPGWPPPSGYSDAVAAEGRMIMLAGQIGWNPVTQRIETDDFAEQVAQALRNVTTALRAAGGEPRHLVRLTWFVTNREAYLSARAPLGAAYRDVMGRHYPAMSVLIVAGLLDPRALVEIEATAVVPR